MSAALVSTALASLTAREMGVSSFKMVPVALVLVLRVLLVGLLRLTLKVLSGATQNSIKMMRSLNIQSICVSTETN